MSSVKKYNAKADEIKSKLPILAAQDAEGFYPSGVDVEDLTVGTVWFIAEDNEDGNN